MLRGDGARICTCAMRKATSRPVELDAALIAEFEAYVGRWLDEIADGRFVPRPHPSQRSLPDVLRRLARCRRARRAGPARSHRRLPASRRRGRRRVSAARPATSCCRRGSRRTRIGRWPCRRAPAAARPPASSAASLRSWRSPGVQPSQLVVITFTEKAAREVSHRLREALGQLGAARRGVHRHHPRVLPVAAAALSRSRPACRRSSRPPTS